MIIVWLKLVLIAVVCCCTTIIYLSIKYTTSWWPWWYDDEWTSWWWEASSTLSQAPPILACRSPNLVHASGSPYHHIRCHLTENKVQSHCSFTHTWVHKCQRLNSKIPTDHLYNMLKEQLTRRTAASEQRWLQQLFNAEELGDRTLPQLLHHLQQLLGDEANHLSAWLIPAATTFECVHGTCPTLDNDNLEELAQLAHKIM